MNDLFRFVALRAPDRTPPGSVASLATGSGFQESLLSIHRASPAPSPAPVPIAPATTPALSPGRFATASAPASVRSSLAGMMTDARMSTMRILKSPAVVGASTMTMFDPRTTLANFTPPPAEPVPPARRDPLQEAKAIVETYLAGGYGGGFIPDTFALPWQDAIANLDRALMAAAPSARRAEAAAMVQTAFGKSAKDLAADDSFKAFRTRVLDTIVALIIHPNARSLPVAELVRVARMLDFVTRVASDDATLDTPGAVAGARTITVVLPTRIFPIRADLPQPVGVGDLLVVKQHLKRYEMGDISQIENILRGEKRNRTQKHQLTLDRTVASDVEKTTETTSALDTTERFDLKTEAENVVKEDINAKAGVSVSAKYGGVEINANADVAYSLSKEQSNKAAVEHAKDVTSRAATKVTERTRLQETTRRTEVFEEREAHGFVNDGPGAKNVSGVYQWVNKVYEAQVYNYGSRLLLDLIVPEPAAFLLDAVATGGETPTVLPPEPFVMVLDDANDPTSWRPVAPTDLGSDGFVAKGRTTRPLTPNDLSDASDSATYFGLYVSRYGAAGVKAMPEGTMTVSKALQANKDDQNHLTGADNLTIPIGYQASEVDVRGGMSMYESADDIDGDEQMLVYVGRRRFEARGWGGKYTPAIASVDAPDGAIDEIGTIPVAVQTQQGRDYAIVVDVKCTLTEAAKTQWKIDTHAAILAAYTRSMSDYQDRRDSMSFGKAAQLSLGTNPAQNALVMRGELKKSCIALLSGTDLYDAAFDDVHVNGAGRKFPRPNVPSEANGNITGGSQGAFIRFFEQAFEWEHIMSIFYPYYWARRETWYEKSLASDVDPLFAEFVKAGAARVVIPVRPQLEGDLRYFLMTGQIWSGGAMPEITDTDYLPITEEIKARDDAPGEEVPQGASWEVTLPTTLVRLRDDDSMPMWNKFAPDGHEVWVPGKIQQGKWTPDYGRLDPKGAWSP